MLTSAANENDQLSQNFEAQEVDSSVQTPRTNVPAAGDQLLVHHQRFEELSNEMQITKACESSGFMRPEEVDCLVQTQERNDEAVGNRFCVCLQKFDELEKEVQFTKECAPAGL